MDDVVSFNIPEEENRPRDVVQGKKCRMVE